MAILAVLILIVLGVHSCQISARNSALKDYTNNVSSLIQQSNQTGTRFFSLLAGGGGAGNATSLQNQINEARLTADDQLSHAKGLSVPDEMRAAQQNLVLALQMRRNGLANIATEIQPALGTSTSKDAVNAIAANIASFYASDVVYKAYTAPKIASALHAASLPVGPPNGTTIASGQFVPNIQWLLPSFVATELHVTLATPNGKPKPGLHGHSLDSVSVGGTTLQTGSTNTVTATPPPTFTLNFTNGGQNTETNVVCKVTVTGTTVTGQTVVAQTTPGEHATCQVPLRSSPPAGQYTVTATVAPVPGEKNTANNTLTFPVTFQ